MKNIGRRGFIASAIAFVGGASYVRAGHQGKQSYDRTFAVMLANKFLAGIETEAVYRIGEEQPMGYAYRGRDKDNKWVTVGLSTLDVEIRLNENRNGEATVVFTPNLKDDIPNSYHPPQYYSVYMWNQMGELDSFRKQNIKDMFRKHVEKNPNLRVRFKNEVDEPSKEFGGTFI